MNLKMEKHFYKFCRVLYTQVFHTQVKLDKIVQNFVQFISM